MANAEKGQIERISENFGEDIVGREVNFRQMQREVILRKFHVISENFGGHISAKTEWAERSIFGEYRERSN